MVCTPLIFASGGFCMEYKGFTAHTRYDAHTGVYWGKIDGIDDLVTFEGDTEEEAAAAFAESVDDYLKMK